MDGSTGGVLSIAPRRKGLLTQLHEGSFWGKAVRYYLFFPAVIGLLFLLVSGAISLFQDYQRQFRRYIKN